MFPRLVSLVWVVLLSILSGNVEGGEKRSKAEKSPSTDQYGDPLPPGAAARLGTTRLRHEDRIGALAFSPNGKILASGGSPLRRWGSRIHLWDPLTGKQIRVFGDEETPRVSALVFSPDGKILVSLGDYEVLFLAGSHRGDEHIPFTKIHLWDVASGKHRLTLTGHDSYVSSAAFSPDGKFLASTSADDSIRFWDVNTGKSIRAINQKVDSFRQVCITPDGKTVVTSGGDSTIRLWDAATGKQTRIIKVPDVGIDIQLSPDGKIVVSCGATGIRNKIRFWDLASGNKLGESPEPGTSGFWRFGPDSQSLLYGVYDQHHYDTQLYLWDWKKGKRVRELKGRPIHVTAATVSPDKQTLAVSDGESVRLWNMATGKEASFLAGHRALIHSVAVSPDGRTAVTGSDDRTIRLWELPSGKLLQVLEGRQRQIASVAFSPDGKQVASGGSAIVRMWDVQSARNLATFTGGEGDWFLSLAFSPDGKTLAGGSWGGKAYRWDVKSGKEHKRLDLQGNASVTPSSLFLGVRNLACISENGSNIYDLDSGDRIPRFRDSEVLILEGELNASAFSPDGNCLATATRGNEIIFRETFTSQIFHSIDIPSPRRRDRRLPAPPDNPETPLCSLAFSPDGRFLATGSGQGKVTIWDWLQGKKLHTFDGPVSRVSTLAFTPDGKYLLSGSHDGTALVWNVPDRLRQPRQEGKALTDAGLRALDAELSGRDAHKAYLAIETLTAAPAQSVPFLRRRLQPITARDAKQASKWIADLDSDRSATRETATRELTQLGDRAESLLRSTLDGNPTVEARRRIEDLLRTITLEKMHTAWAILVLERIGTPEARQILQDLSRGDPAAWQTRIAKAALERIARR